MVRRAPDRVEGEAGPAPPAVWIERSGARTSRTFGTAKRDRTRAPSAIEHGGSDSLHNALTWRAPVDVHEHVARAHATDHATAQPSHQKCGQCVATVPVGGRAR